MGWSFKDKVVFISGSAAGIGKSTAVAFAKAGAKVIINGCHEEKVKRCQLELQQLGVAVSVFVADVSDDEACEALQRYILNTFGRLDIFIANAGLSSKDVFEKTKPDIFKKIVQNNIFSVTSAFYAMLPLLKESKGSFVVINSLAALHGLPTSSAYSVSKMGIRAFVESVSPEVNNSGVHLGNIYFGFIKNDASKTTYNGEGVLVQVPHRDFAVVKREDAVNKILQCCYNRTHNMYVSWLVKIIFIMSRISPRLLNFLFRLNVDRFIAAQKLNH